MKYELQGTSYKILQIKVSVYASKLTIFGEYLEVVQMFHITTFLST